APYEEKDYEAEIRASLSAAARTGRVLEVNTTRGHTLCPDLTVVRWWRELGGQAVQYGSDAHQPDKVGEGFRIATQMVEAAAFKPARDPVSLESRCPATPPRAPTPAPPPLARTAGSGASATR